MRWLADELDRRGAGVPATTLTATYRQCLEERVRPGTLVAVQELVRLEDAASLDRMDTRLDDLEQARELGESDPIGRWNAERTSPKLRIVIEERRTRIENR